jgi:uncharacterized protein YbaR (Trm112 family)
MADLPDLPDLPDFHEALQALSSLLRCPITGQQLHIATPQELRALSTHSGDGFLVREDQTAAYPVVNGIPSLLPESLIALIL